MKAPLRARELAGVSVTAAFASIAVTSWGGAGASLKGRPRSHGATNTTTIAFRLTGPPSSQTSVGHSGNRPAASCPKCPSDRGMRGPCASVESAQSSSTICYRQVVAKSLGGLHEDDSGEDALGHHSREDALTDRDWTVGVIT